ncbi:MAG: nucleoside deaminase [Kiritimatiellae bacterium]|nr:nucleoside deaminase [Kiritimatiellia bacterium]
MTAPAQTLPAAGARSRKGRWILAALAVAVAVGAGLYVGLRRSGSAYRDRRAWGVPSDEQAERDEIFTLLAFAVAHKDWQEERPDKRGFNIGAVVVDASGTNAVSWGRNCNVRLGNATQHAELRAMLGYLDDARIYSLTGCTVYATLEPCAQCAGMMTMLGVRRVVYGQADPEYGKAFERLQLHSRGRLREWRGKQKRGYVPYPRAVAVHRSRSDLTRRLEEAHDRSGSDMPDFLCSEEVRALFEEARRALDAYRVRHPENESALSSARSMLESVPEDYAPLGLDL